MFTKDDLLKFSTQRQGSTRIKVCPAGNFVGIVSDTDKWSVRESEGKKASTMGQVFRFLEIPIIIDDARVREELDRALVTVRFSTGLDLTSTGDLDMSEGKNVGLNRIREAVGQNVHGQAWEPSMLANRPLRVTVKNYPDPRDASQDLAEISAVAQL